MKKIFLNKQPAKQKGFNLVELMVVVIIIAIIAAFAIPGYQRHVLATKRKAAIADILSLQQALERQYNVNNGSYAQSDATGSCATEHELYTSGSPVAYAFALDIAENKQSYTITAKPCSTQLKDECGSLRINSLGLKEVTRKNNAFSTDGSCF